MGKKISLSIAGSDPSAGAGIQADIKIFNQLNLHGISVITCITSQNTITVKKIFKIPTDIIESQIDTLYNDFKVSSVKIGMLYDSEIIQSISKKISQYNMKPVVDPIISATTGDTLSKNDFIESFKKHIIPKTFLLTPNIDEASKLTGKKISSKEDVKNACKTLCNLGAKNILIKGGHLKSDEAIDIFYNKKKFTSFPHPKIPKTVHGSGCSYSALIAGFIATGDEPINAIEKSKNILWNMIYESQKIGKGSNILNFSTKNLVPIKFQSKEHFDVWLELKNGVEKLISFLPIDYIPEVGMNFAYGVKNANSFKKICAIDGRILKTRQKPIICGEINFDMSRHIAAIILTSMLFNKKMRSALNIKYSKDILKNCENTNLKIGSFDRKNEPKDIVSTMEWGTKTTIESLKCVPDIIFDEGGMGKEPMIRIIGKNPTDILSKLKKIIGI